MVSFVVFCGLLVIESGLNLGFCRNDKAVADTPCILLQKTEAEENDSSADVPVKQNAQLKAADFPVLGAEHGPAKSITLGSIDFESGFKFLLELSSKGAAIKKATFNEFDDRDYKDPQPLMILSPVGDKVLSMANKEFVFVEHQLQLPLNNLHWQSYDVEKTPDGSQTVRFETTIQDKTSGEPIVKLTKTYKVTVGSYQIDCDLTVENLSDGEQRVRFNLAGPVGLGREGARSDMRKAVAGFRNSKGEITSERLAINKLRKATSVDDRRLIKNSDRFLWVAATNKYFTAILVPVPDEGQDFCDWVAEKTGQFYNPDGDSKADSGDETIGVGLKIASSTLAAVGQSDSASTYQFQLYLGPKDKRLFDKNQQYRNLGFVQTIDFMGCCCPASIISPLAFFILRVMEVLYSMVGNYGVVIIILVLLIRLIMHPITKKSQVSMSKMTSLGPKVEAIKKKYAGNKTEMNKQMMALYKEQGASPIMGFLPMMVQMPVWIALWSAIYASIALRGAAFLPFWITDLSVPDALFRFPAVTLPLFGKLDSFNLLPILMGVAMYLQQKLMPKPAAAMASPQAAQQQKMMMIMMPLFLPLVLYKGPSGVNLYIMASTFAGVIEQHVIRKHIREKEQRKSQGLVAATSKTGGKVKKKKAKPFYRQF